jgi:hypothetical protein
MEVEGFVFQFCEVTSIGKNPQENLTFIDDKISKKICPNTGQRPKVVLKNGKTFQ